MISGQYPFLGDTLQETYDKVQKNRLFPFLLILFRKMHETHFVATKIDRQ
jgi:hypothetical protein